MCSTPVIPWRRFAAIGVLAVLPLWCDAAAEGPRAPDRALDGLPATPAEPVEPRPAVSVTSTVAPLDALITEALQNNPEIGTARNEAEAARQRVAPAGALEDPMLEAGVTNLPVSSWRFDRAEMTMKMLGVAQRLPFPGKRGLRKGVAASEAESIALGYRETVNRVVRDLKAAYYDLALVIESIRLVQNNKQVLEQFLQIAEARYQVGQGDQADVLKAQTQLSMMMDELLDLGRERPMIEAELDRALGRLPGAGGLLPAPLRLQETALPFEALLETALAQRPQLLGMQSLIQRSDKALELARKEYYPDFDVRVAYGQREEMRDGTDLDDMVSLTVAVNLPIWRQSRLEPQVAEAAAMRYGAIDMYRAEQNEVAAMLRAQVATAEQSFQSARLYETGILPQARLSVEASLAAYKVGRVDFLTLLDNQMTVFSYEIGHATALSSYNKALAEIDLITGKPGL